MPGIKSLIASGSKYPEYPGAALTELVFTYSSVVDPTKTNLKARIYYPTGKKNLPLCSCIHGFDQQATDMSPSEEMFRRIARTGKFVVAFEMRGSAGSGGTITFANDAGGRQKFDIRDGEDAIELVYSASLAYSNGVLRREIFSMSFGGTVSIGMARAFPDRYVNVTAYYPAVNCTTWDTWLLANGGAARSALLRTYIGGSPAALPDEWAVRNGNNVNNVLSEFFFAADTADASVEVAESQNLAAALQAAGKKYTYNESTVGSPYRWSHGSPDVFADLIQLEPLWKNKVKFGNICSMPAAGIFDVPGCLVTRSFQIMLSDGNLNNSGRCRTGTYNLATGLFTNTSSQYCVAVYKDLATGNIDAQIVAAGATCVFAPTAQTISGPGLPVGGYALGACFEVSASRVLVDGSNNVLAFCDSTGGWAAQGYAVRFVGAKPLYVAAALNGKPAIRFTSATSQYLEGELIKCMQNKSKFTKIVVSTGLILSHGANANELTQIALAGGSYFGVVANGAGSNGAYVGTATPLVRVEIYDGTQATNATRYQIRENKVNKALTFTSNIPATTEGNAASKFTMGKRYDATFFGGDLEYFAWVTDTSLSIAEADAAADISKAEYTI